MRYKIQGITWVLFLLSAAYTYGQSHMSKLQEIQGLIETAGEVFIAIDRINPGDNKVCLEENSFINQMQFSGDSAFVNYINYTELFCEAYVLRSQHTFQFNLKDIDPATMRLVEKKYMTGNGKLKEGNPGWFEVQLFTKDKKEVIIKNDPDSKQQESISSVSILVKEKDTAKQVLSLLKNVLQNLQGP